MTRDARLSALHRGDFGLPGPRFRLRHCLRITSSSHPGRSAWRAGSRASRGERSRAAAAGRHASLRIQDRLENTPPMSEAGQFLSIAPLRSQEIYSKCSLWADAASGRAIPTSAHRRDARERRIDASETPLESVRRRRFNPSTPAHAGKPTREERHGQGSDAQQQGEEEAEGGVEQKEERRPHALAVRAGAGTSAARAESLRQEELAERPQRRAARGALGPRARRRLTSPLAGSIPRAKCEGGRRCVVGKRLQLRFLYFLPALSPSSDGPSGDDVV